VYGRRKKRLPLKRHFLHAAELTLRHPVSQEEMTFTAELPPDLTAILENLEQ
jgi:23S rRNA pseudouridine1911/1915/1917 synthase